MCAKEDTFGFSFFKIFMFLHIGFGFFLYIIMNMKKEIRISFVLVFETLIFKRFLILLRDLSI